MRADAKTEDCQAVTVHAVSFDDRRGTVLYASVPCEPSASESLKHLLVSTLWDHLMVIENLHWKHYQSYDRSAFPIQVGRNLLGRPHLLLGEHPGPSISFSQGEGRIWAALSGDESDIGIDVAGPNEFKTEFRGEYPFHRVFHPDELQHALRLVGGDLEKASALLWSVKEAVVKALGSAFHLVDPREVTVYPPEESAAEITGGYDFPVGLSGKALVRFPLTAGQSLWAHSLPQGKAWLSLALLNRKPAEHE